MGKTVAHKLIESHLLDGKMKPGEEIALKWIKPSPRMPPVRWSCSRKR